MFLTDFLAVPAVLSIYVCWRWRRRLRSVFIGPALLLITLLPLVASGYSLWYEHRPLPAAERRELASGITFIRELRATPRPLVIHVVAIDLDQPGLEFLVTPAEPNQGRQLRARTTSQFVKEFPVTAAINASFFYPWHSNGPLDYYPHAGDPCDVCGKCVSRGAAYSSVEHGFNLLSISKDNRVTIGGEAEGAWNAVSGREILLQDGEPVADLLDGPLMAQTAVGVDRTGRKMIWLVVDGRQPNFSSEGVTLKELAGICKDYGVWSALTLDGGDSSTLVARAENGEPVVLNCPIHGRHPPGRERPVANHLGVVIMHAKID